jgi:hypothetical protein
VIKVEGFNAGSLDTSYNISSIINKEEEFVYLELG